MLNEEMKGTVHYEYASPSLTYRVEVWKEILYRQDEEATPKGQDQPMYFADINSYGPSCKSHMQILKPYLTP